MTHDDLKLSILKKMSEPSGLSFHTDEENSRGPTSGEVEFYGTPNHSDPGLLAAPTSGPLAGMDLVNYMRTGRVRYYNRGPAIPAPTALPMPVPYVTILIPYYNTRGEQDGVVARSFPLAGQP